MSFVTAFSHLPLALKIQSFGELPGGEMDAFNEFPTHLQAQRKMILPSDASQIIPAELPERANAFERLRRSACAYAK